MTAGSKQDRRECHSEAADAARVACDYAMRATDPACTGCVWRSGFGRAETSDVLRGRDDE